jgi:hypothetical protein
MMMKRLLLFVAFLLGLSLSAFAQAQQSKLPPCPEPDDSKWDKCFGTYKSENGSSYTGEFAKGKFSGKGVFKYPNGDEYFGDFKADKKEGRGTYIFKNGDKYVGEFKDRNFNGQGKYIFADGRPSILGIWKNGQFIRNRR